MITRCTYWLSYEEAVSTMCGLQAAMLIINVELCHPPPIDKNMATFLSMCILNSKYSARQIATYEQYYKACVI
jgi:hypothetical protein